MGEWNFDMTGKVVLVTGGSRGIGKDIALAMAELGAKVVICSRKQEGLDGVVQEFKDKGHEVIARATHIAKSEQVGALFQFLGEEYGRLDILINNVGMNIMTPAVADVEEGLWDKIVETNLKGTFLVSSHAVKLMRKGNGGKIVNITTVAARKAAMGMGVYGVAKAGVEMLTRVLAAELASDHINVNAVAPGMVKTKFSKPFWGDESTLKELTRTIPMGRIAEKADVVGAVLYLSSDLADYVTGQVITVDGGALA
jgi:NAD(P)-dependent dehydrogenase (short-subunit alcohol dehydrogenase family)